MEELQAPNLAGKLMPVHLEYARSFLNASMVLDDASARICDDGPIYHSSATGLELTLKALLSLLGRSEEVIRAFNHGLSALYNAVMLDAQGRALLEEAERVSRQNWKAMLRDKRSQHIADLLSGTIQSDQATPTNADIGNGRPRFCDAVSWLDERHKDDGGQFRYVKTGPDQRLYIINFGLQKRIIPQTVYWVCDHILERLEALLSDSKIRAFLTEQAIAQAVLHTLKTPTKSRS